MPRFEAVGYNEAMRRAHHHVPSLEEAFGRPLRVVWTDNRSVYLSLRPPGGQPFWTLRLHGTFRGAPEPVWGAVQAFLRTRRRACLEILRDHFARHASVAEGRRRRIVLRPRGRYHDLQPLLAGAVAGPLFSSLPPVGVTWGTRRGAGARCVRLGSYRRAEGSGETAVVRVHPLLDGPAVPPFVIASVLHHELVHHLLTCRDGAEAGRRHGAEFCGLDRLFPRHREAENWLELELPRRLGRKPCTAPS